MKSATKNKKAKVSFLIPTLEGGGAERVFLTLANGLAERGFIVNLVVLDARGPYLSEVSSKVNLIMLHCKIRQGFFKLAQHIKVYKPDFLVSALEHTNILAIVVGKLFKLNTKIIISERVFKHKLAYKSISHFIFFRIFSKLTYPLSDHIIAVSKDLKDIILKNYKIKPEKVSVLYNPISGFQKKYTNDNKKLLIDYKPYILAAGRLTHQKGFLNLVHAFSEISNVIKHNLIIIGEGEDRDKIETEIKLKNLEGRVILPGFIENIYSIMSNAELFVLSSFYEGFPNVLIQAMYAGLPIVATNCPTGPSEILENGKWGELVEISDTSALASGILRVLNNKNNSINVKKRSEEFNLESCLDNLENILQKTKHLSI